MLRASAHLFSLFKHKHNVERVELRGKKGKNSKNVAKMLGAENKKRAEIVIAIGIMKQGIKTNLRISLKLQERDGTFLVGWQGNRRGLVFGEGERRSHG